MYIYLTRCVVNKSTGLLIFREADLEMADGRSVDGREIAKKTFRILMDTGICDISTVDLTVPGYVYPGGNLGYISPFP
jgi:hypothetical protein